MSVHIIFKKERNKRKKGRKKERKVRSLTFFVIVLRTKKKERKNRKIRKEIKNGEFLKERKKERKKESCDLWLATSKEKGKESRQIVRKAGWRHNGTVSSVFEFVCFAMYLLNLHWQQQTRERKWESPFINDTDNFILQIIPSLLHESCVFSYYNNIRDTFHLLIDSF